MAHGLVLRIQDMAEYTANVEVNQGLRLNGSSTDTNDVKIIKRWIGAVNHPKNSKMEFFTLLRETLLLILSPKWIKSSTQKDLIYAFKHHNRCFSSIVRNGSEIYNAVLQLSVDPWLNTFFSWEDLFQGNVTIEDKCVQDYFYSEPEEIVLARVNFLQEDNETNYRALALAKQSFLYHYRITKHAVFYSKSASRERNRFIEERSRRGHASVDWVYQLLQKIKSLPQLVKEMQQFTCHEGIELIGRMREHPKYKRFSYDLMHILLIQDLTKPSQYCCTKKLFILFCIMHKELNSGPKEIAASAAKILAKMAPSSAHFYLFVDAAYEQFGTRCIDLYVEFYVRGLTADLNQLDFKKQAGASDDINNLETHIASIFSKLSSLFNNINEEASRECMLSAFSLRPSEERFHELQRLTDSLNNSNKRQLNITTANSSLFSISNCSSHGLRCDGNCNVTTNSGIDLVHPLLNKGIRNISYNVIKDFVSVLESARCITFQYNIFDWHRNFNELSDYLTAFNLKKPVQRDWSSDTEVGSDGSNKSDSEESESKIDSNASSLLVRKVVPPVKRKSDSNISRESFPLDVGANIEVGSNDSANKRVKVQKPSLKAAHSPVMSELSRSSGDPLHSAIENVIRKTLNDNIPKGQSVIYSLPGKYNQTSNSAQVSITPGTSKMPGENPTAYAYPKQINSIPEHTHHLTSGSNNPVLNIRPQGLSNYSSQVPLSTPAISKHTVNRQSVVVTPVSNSSSKRTDSPQQQDPSKLCYLPAQKSLVTVNFPVQKAWKDSNLKNVEGNKNNHGALNLSSGRSHSEKIRHFQNYISKASYFAPSEPINESPSQYDLSYTPPPKRPNQGIHFDKKMPVSRDRNSVIQHTMQHVSQKTLALSNQLSVSGDSSPLPHIKERSSPILNQLSVSADSSAMYLIKNSRTDTSSPFKMNVSQPNHPVSAHNVMSHKPSLAVSSQSTMDFKSSLNRCNTAELSRKLPSLPSSVSSIVLPSRGNMSHNASAKIAAITNVSPVQKSYPKSYDMQFDSTSKLQAHLLKQGSTIEPTKPTTTSLLKPVVSVKQSFSPSNQQWTTANYAPNFTTNQHLKTKDITRESQWLPSSVQRDSTVKTNSNLAHFQTSSSPTTISNQAWYSSPYPKMTESSNDSLPSSFNSNIKYTEASGVMQKLNHNALVIESDKKHAMLKVPQFSRSDNLPPQTSESFLLKSRLGVPNSFTSSSTSKLGTNLTDSKVSSLDTNAKLNSRHHSEMPVNLSSAPSSSVTTSISNSYLFCDRLAKSSPNHYNSNSCDSVLVRDDRGVIVVRTTNAVSTSQYSHAQSGSGTFGKTCCSPQEVEPCQSCSSLNKSKAYNAPKQPDSRENNASQAINHSNMVPIDLLSDNAESNQSSKTPFTSFEPLDSDEDPVVACQFCSSRYPISIMMNHLENSHPSALKDEEHSFTSSNEKASLGVYSSSSLQKPSTSALKHDPGGGNTSTDDENLLNMCYDLLSDQQDLSKLVSNTNCLDQMNSAPPLMQYGEEFENNSKPSVANLSNAYKDGAMKNASSESEHPNLSYVLNEKSEDLFSNFGKNCQDALASSSENTNIISSCSSTIDREASKVINFMNSSNLQEFLVQRSNNEVNMKLSSSSCIEINPRADVAEDEESSLYICGICKEKMKSRTALQKHIAECYLKFADEAFESLSPNQDMQLDGSDGNTESKFDSLFNSICKSSEDSRNDDASNPPGIFEFDPCGSDLIVKETYRPVQKGKLKPNPNKANLTFKQNLMGISKVGSPSMKAKREPKTPCRPCQYCGKMLTVLYMKQHLLKKHKNENLDEINSHQRAANSSFVHENKMILPPEDIDANGSLSSPSALHSQIGITLSEHFNKLSGYNDSDAASSNSQISLQTSNSKGKEVHESLKSKIKLKIFNKSESFTCKESDSPGHLDKDSGIKELATAKGSQKTYRCPVCSRTLINESFLKKHLKTLHNFNGPLTENLIDNMEDRKPVLSPESFKETKPEIDNQEKNLLETNAEFIHQAPFKSSSYSEENSQNPSTQVDFLNSDLKLPCTDGTANADTKIHLLKTDITPNKPIGTVKKRIEKIHKCHLCPKIFSYNRNLKKHIESHNSIQSSSLSQPKDNCLTMLGDENKPNEQELLHLSESYSKITQPSMKPIPSNGYSAVSKDIFTSVSDQVSSAQVSRPLNFNHPSIPIYSEQSDFTSKNYKKSEFESNLTTAVVKPSLSEDGLIASDENEICNYECHFCFEKYSNETDLNRHFEQKHSVNSNFNNVLDNIEASHESFLTLNSSAITDRNINASQNALFPSKFSANTISSENVSVSRSNSVLETGTNQMNLFVSRQNSEPHNFKAPYQQEQFRNKLKPSLKNESSICPQEALLDEKNGIASANGYSERANAPNQKSAILDEYGTDMKKASISKKGHQCDICMKIISTTGNLQRHKNNVHSITKNISGELKIQKSVPPKSVQFSSNHPGNNFIGQNVGTEHSKLFPNSDKGVSLISNPDIFSESFKMPDYASPPVDQTISNADNFDRMLSELFSATEERDESLRTFTNALAFDVDQIEPAIPGTMNESYERDDTYETKQKQEEATPNVNAGLSHQPNIELLVNSKFEPSAAVSVHSSNNHMTELLQRNHTVNIYRSELDKNERTLTKQSFFDDKNRYENSSDAIQSNAPRGVSTNNSHIEPCSSEENLGKVIQSSNPQFTSETVQEAVQSGRDIKNEKELDEVEIAKKVAFYSRPNNECGICFKSYSSKSILNVHLKKVHFRLKDSMTKTKRKNSVCSSNEINTADSSGMNILLGNKKKAECPICRKVLNKNGLTRHIRTLHESDTIVKRNVIKIVSSNAQQPSTDCRDNMLKMEEIISKCKQESLSQTNQHISMHSESSLNAQSWTLLSQEKDHRQKCLQTNLTENLPNNLIGSAMMADNGNFLLPSGQERHKSLSESISVVSGGEDFNSCPNPEIIDSEEKSMPHLEPECKLPSENELRQLREGNNLDPNFRKFEMNLDTGESNIKINQNENQSDSNKCFQNAHSLPNTVGKISESFSTENFHLPNIEFHTSSRSTLKLPEDSNSLLPLLMGDSPTDESETFSVNIIEPCVASEKSLNNDLSSNFKELENSFSLNVLNNDTPMKTSIKMSPHFAYDTKPLTDGSYLNQVTSPNKEGCDLNNHNEARLDLNEDFDPAYLNTKFSQAAINLTPKSIKEYNSNVSNSQSLNSSTMPLVNDSSNFLGNLEEQKHVYSYNHNFVLSVLKDLGVSQGIKTESFDQNPPPESESLVCNVSNDDILPNHVENPNSDFKDLDPLHKYSPPQCNPKFEKNSVSVLPPEIKVEVQQTLVDCLDKVSEKEDVLNTFDESNCGSHSDVKKQVSVCLSSLSVESKTVAISKNRKKPSLNAKCKQIASISEKNVSVLKKSNETSYSVLHGSKSNNQNCQQCQKRFKSTSALMRHLKFVHNVPVLKKEISNSRVKCSPEDDSKLSPPDLSLISTPDSVPVTTTPVIIYGDVRSSSSVREVVPTGASQSDQYDSFECKPPEGLHSPTAETDNPDKISLKLKTLCKPLYLRKRSLCRGTKSKSSNSRTPAPTGFGIKNEVIEDEGEFVDSVECKPPDQSNLIENSSSVQGVQSNTFGVVPTKKKAFRKPSRRRIEPVCNSEAHPSRNNVKAIAKGESVIDKNPLMHDQNFLNTKSALPKCIIKVYKDEGNSVSYQIHNSQNKPDIELISESVSLENNSSKPVLRKRSIENLNDDDDDDCVILSSDSEKSDELKSKRRGRRKCFRSNFSQFTNSLHRAMNFKSGISRLTTKSQFIKKTDVKSKKQTAVKCKTETAVIPEKEIAVNFKKETAVNYEKETAVNYEIETAVNLEKETAVNLEKETTSLSLLKNTKEVHLQADPSFKGPINIEQFLKEHKQPLVQLTRIDSMHVNGYIQEKDTTASPLHHSGVSLKKPVVILERIKIENSASNNHDKIQINPVADTSTSPRTPEVGIKSVICNKNTKLCPTPVKSSNGITNEKTTLREKSNMSIDVHVDVGLRGEGSKKPDSQDPKYCAPGDEENCVVLPSMKECCVVLKKLPV